jgi:lysophospholipase L1-like esterase
MTLSRSQGVARAFFLGALLLTPLSLTAARAQSAQAAPVPPAAPQASGAPQASSSDAAPTGGPSQANGGAPAGQAATAGPSQQKGLTERAIDRVKTVAKQAGDIFNRVPCSPPKGGVPPVGSLPHVAKKLVAGEAVVIVAFGSSSTQGWGSSAPEFTYPNRLMAQLKRQYPTADITVINRGKGGEDAPEMMKRLQSAVLDMKPDLVIWQVGTNAVLRGFDPDVTEAEVEEGIARIQAAGSDVVLVDPQYSPAVTQHAEGAGRMVGLLKRIARLRHVGIFPRFEVMRDWHEKQAIPVDNFVTADGLHMNDWGYACFAQILGDDIIKSVGQIKLGRNVPAEVLTYRPM